MGDTSAGCPFVIYNQSPCRGGDKGDKGTREIRGRLSKRTGTQAWPTDCPPGLGRKAAANPQGII